MVFFKRENHFRRDVASILSTCMKIIFASVPLERKIKKLPTVLYSSIQLRARENWQLSEPGPRQNAKYLLSKVQDHTLADLKFTLKQEMGVY